MSRPTDSLDQAAADPGPLNLGSLAGYLAAKRPLDERSLNPAVRRLFRRWIRAQPRLRALDLGTGTGVAVQRLLRESGPSSVAVTAVDRDSALLRQAQRQLVRWLSRTGYIVSTTATSLVGIRPEKTVTIDFLAADLTELGVLAPTSAGFDLILAHQVLDLLPPGLLAPRLAAWLRPQGLCYATLNYDGATALFPAYVDAHLEQRILAVYEQSMENRRVAGQATGGAHCARRWHAALIDAGLSPIGLGSSTWDLIPIAGRYRHRDRECIDQLLTWIHGEAKRSGQIDAAALKRWQADRRALLQIGKLGLIIHQVDLLAERSGLPSKVDR